MIGQWAVTVRRVCGILLLHLLLYEVPGSLADVTSSLADVTSTPSQNEWDAWTSTLSQDQQNELVETSTPSVPTAPVPRYTDIYNLPSNPRQANPIKRVYASPHRVLVGGTVQVRCEAIPGPSCQELAMDRTSLNFTVSTTSNDSFLLLEATAAPKVLGTTLVRCSCRRLGSAKAEHVRAIFVIVKEPLQPATDIRCVSENYANLVIYWRDPNFKYHDEAHASWEVSYAIRHSNLLFGSGTTSNYSLVADQTFRTNLTKVGDGHYYQSYTYEVVFVSSTRDAVPLNFSCVLGPEIVLPRPVDELSVEPIAGGRSASITFKSGNRHDFSMKIFYSANYLQASMMYQVVAVSTSNEPYAQGFTKTYEFVSRNETLTYNLDGLLPNTPYNLSVSARVTSSLYSSTEVTMHFKTLEGVPDVAPVVSPYGFSFTDHGCGTNPDYTQVKVYWKHVAPWPTKGNGIISGYTMTKWLLDEENPSPARRLTVGLVRQQSTSTQEDYALRRRKIYGLVKKTGIFYTETDLCVSRHSPTDVSLRAGTGEGLGNASSTIVVPSREKVEPIPSCGVTASINVGEQTMTVRWPSDGSKVTGSAPARHVVFWCEVHGNGCQNQQCRCEMDIEWADVPIGSTNHTISVRDPVHFITNVGVARIDPTTGRSTGITWAGCTQSVDALERKIPDLVVTVADLVARVLVTLPCQRHVAAPDSYFINYCKVDEEAKEQGTCLSEYCCKGPINQTTISSCQGEYMLRLPSPSTTYQFWAEAQYGPDFVSSALTEVVTPADTAFPPLAWLGVAAGILLLVTLAIVACHYRYKPTLDIKNIRIPQRHATNAEAGPYRGGGVDRYVVLGSSSCTYPGASSLSLATNKDGAYDNMWSASGENLGLEVLPGKDKLHDTQTSRDSGIPDVEGFERKRPAPRQTFTSTDTNVKRDSEWTASLPSSSSSSLLSPSDEGASADSTDDADSLPHPKKGTPPPQYHYCCPAGQVDDEGYHGRGATGVVPSAQPGPTSSIDGLSCLMGDGFITDTAAEALLSVLMAVQVHPPDEDSADEEHAAKHEDGAVTATEDEAYVQCRPESDNSGQSSMPRVSDPLSSAGAPPLPTAENGEAVSPININDFILPDQFPTDVINSIPPARLAIETCTVTNGTEENDHSDQVYDPMNSEQLSDLSPDYVLSSVPLMAAERMDSAFGSDIGEDVEGRAEAPSVSQVTSHSGYIQIPSPSKS